VIFLAKRDGIDQVVKALQYVGKLAHYGLVARSPALAARCKRLEVAAGLGRKVFRAGRSLTGLNALRTAGLTVQLLSVFGHSGEIVYWLFDHCTWLSQVGVLSPSKAATTLYISALGESVACVFFITIDTIALKRGLEAELGLRKQLAKLDSGWVNSPTNAEQENLLRIKLRVVKMQRLMLAVSIVARVSDLLIALSVADPNPFVSHAVTLGLSGLASAWAGWYQQWPESA
jgi:hypothetical protein